MSLPRWDIFCKVVDNFGDIGVAWRLARSLAAEHSLEVRLWVDDLATLARIWPVVDPARAAQCVAGVEVRRWVEPLLGIEPADVVVETFQCDIPEPYVQAMAAMTVKPRWINLDYLSAERWVSECHALPSPHPRLPLVKHFFFPGFDRGTGGVLLEAGLLAARTDFVESREARAAHWRDLGLSTPAPDELRVSLFCYPSAPIADLVRGWMRSPRRLTCLVPEGPVADGLLATFGQAACRESCIDLQQVRIRVIPFTDQDRYDRLLWNCDFNFVRGEDSFVRAQWAARPWIWNTYPQADNAHWIKLNAFLDRFCDGLASDAATAVRDLWRAWNGLSRPSALEDSWARFADHSAGLGQHAQLWSQRLAALGSLASNLVRFCLRPI